MLAPISEGLALINQCYALLLVVTNSYHLFFNMEFRPTTRAFQTFSTETCAAQGALSQ